MNRGIEQDQGASASPTALSSADADQAPSGLAPDGLQSTGAGPERITVAEFHARLKAQGVASMNHAALVCPMCGTVQSMASLVAAGCAPEEAERLIGFSCEGRLTDAGPWPTKPKRRAVRGCDWSLGGLFRLHALEVITEDGEAHPRFVVATPEQAQALEAASVDRSGAAGETRSEAKGLDPKDESAVGAEGAETPKGASQ